MQREAEPIVISTTLSNKLAIFIVQMKTESWVQLSDGKPGKMEQLETENPHLQLLCQGHISFQTEGISPRASALRDETRLRCLHR